MYWFLITKQQICEGEMVSGIAGFRSPDDTVWIPFLPLLLCDPAFLWDILSVQISAHGDPDCPQQPSAYILFMAGDLEKMSFP